MPLLQSLLLVPIFYDVWIYFVSAKWGYHKEQDAEGRSLAHACLMSLRVPSGREARMMSRSTSSSNTRISIELTSCLFSGGWGIRDSGSGFRVQGSGIKDQGLGIRVDMVEGCGLRVEG